MTTSSPAALNLYRPSLPGEFLTAVHAAIIARTRGHDAAHYHHAKVAEDVIRRALPVFDDDIRAVASRKGRSGAIGRKIGVQLSGPIAAALAVAWSIRSARTAGVEGVFSRAARKPGFGSTLLKLLGPIETKRLLRRVGWSGAIQP
ncbi:MAG TPA: hypothetical protein PLN53_01270 [Terricaulis sp.]|nr:hypothetical protein [Terricaulis sp.]